MIRISESVNKVVEGRMSHDERLLENEHLN